MRNASKTVFDLLDKVNKLIEQLYIRLQTVGAAVDEADYKLGLTTIEEIFGPVKDMRAEREYCERRRDAFMKIYNAIYEADNAFLEVQEAFWSLKSETQSTIWELEDYIDKDCAS